jgi:hypothetical protein
MQGKTVAAKVTCSIEEYMISYLIHACAISGNSISGLFVDVGLMHKIKTKYI